MKLIVTLEKDETGVITVECPLLPGCISQGKTEEEALENIHEAIVGCFDARTRARMTFSVTIREVEVEI